MGSRKEGRTDEKQKKCQQHHLADRKEKELSLGMDCICCDSLCRDSPAAAADPW